MGWPRLESCQDEALQVTALEEGPDGRRLCLREVFDRDWASQFDQTLERTGTVELHEAGGLRCARWTG